MTRAQFQSVLVIADPALESLMKLLAEKDQWKIHISNTMADAFAELSRQTYDVLITGPDTAASQDLEFFKRVRKTVPRIKLIALSSEGEKRDVIEAIQESAFSYFAAPFSAESIVAMVETALNAEDWKDGIELVSNLPSWVTLRVSSSRVTAERVAQFMRELESDLPEAEREAVGIAFREMLLNAMEHGGGFDPASKVDLSYVRTKRMILYQLYDPGPGFLIDRLPQAATSNPTDQPFAHLTYRIEHGLRPGGFGILVTRELVDDLLYNEKGNGVLLIKYVSPDLRDQHQVEPSE
jgi:DNA-binding response OmpR family regulator